MTRLVIFGAGGTGRRVYQKVKDKYSVIGFADNDSSRWNSENIDGIPVFDPANLIHMDFDCIMLGTFMGCDEIRRQLKNLNVPENKIVSGYVEISVNARDLFLKRTAEEYYRREQLMGGGGRYKSRCCRSRRIPRRICEGNQQILFGQKMLFV